MDRLVLQEKALEYLKKYRYLLLVVFCGIFLMALPTRSPPTELPDESKSSTQERQDLQKALEDILSYIDGAGEVQVLLTQVKGEEILYQLDEDISTAQDSSDIRKETVIVSESGLIRQVNPPIYLGAVILCQGGNDPVVRLSVVDAVADATGLTTDHITVLKMK